MCILCVGCMFCVYITHTTINPTPNPLPSPPLPSLPSPSPSLQVSQTYTLLTKWASPSPQQAIELLDARFTDPIVRQYAVSRLEGFSDEDCEQIVLQLCQVIRERDTPFYLQIRRISLSFFCFCDIINELTLSLGVKI